MTGTGTGEPIYDALFAERYDRPNATQRHTKEPTVNLLADIRDEVARAVNWTEEELKAKLPTVARLADAADAVANSGAAKAILAAVLSPADEAMIVGLVQRLDQSVHTAEADAEPPAAPADEPVQPEQPEQPADAGPADQPAGPVTFPPLAGPVIGGTAR